MFGKVSFFSVVLLMTQISLAQRPATPVVYEQTCVKDVETLSAPNPLVPHKIALAVTPAGGPSGHREFIRNVMLGHKIAATEYNIPSFGSVSINGALLVPVGAVTKHGSTETIIPYLVEVKPTCEATIVQNTLASNASCTRFYTERELIARVKQYISQTGTRDIRADYPVTLGLNGVMQDGERIILPVAMGGGAYLIFMDKDCKIKHGPVGAGGGRLSANPSGI